MERIRAKVINVAEPGEHITVCFCGDNYGYADGEEYMMPKTIFDYLNSIEKTKWVQDKNDKVPRQVKTKKYIAVALEPITADKKKEVIKEVLKAEKRKTDLADILED